MLKELTKVEQRYDVVVAVIRDGMSVTDAVVGQRPPPRIRSYRGRRLPAHLATLPLLTISRVGGWPSP